ncbi:MAG: hypothetical protein FJ091_01930 [Deltaproteobacteria bacterium]|nr:hypothetical protein [Deltaproteobacteria bacterium]
MARSPFAITSSQVEEITIKKLNAKLWILTALLATAGAANAQTGAQGIGTLSGGERLGVRGCGRTASPVTLAVTLNQAGAWSANDGTTTLTGTATALSRPVLSLTLDSASLAAFETALESEASDLCDEAVAISSLRVRSVLKINKRETFAKMRAHAVGQGTSASGSGAVQYKLRVRGAWNRADI